MYAAAARMDKIDKKMFGEQYRLSPRTGAIIYPVLGIRKALPLPQLLWGIYSYSASIRAIPRNLYDDATNNGTESPATRYALQNEEDLHRHLKEEAQRKAIADRAATEAIEKLKSERPSVSHAEHARAYHKEKADTFHSALTPWQRLVMRLFINYKPKTVDMTFDNDTLGITATGMDNATSGIRRRPDTKVDVYVSGGVGTAGGRHAARR